MDQEVLSDVKEHEAFTTISPHFREAVRPTQARLSTVIPHDDLPFYKYRSIFHGEPASTLFGA